VVPHFKVEAKHARLAGVFSLYQALKRRRSELAQTLLIGRWRPMSSFDKSQTKKKKKRKTTAKKVAMITTKTTTATRFENYPFLTP